MRENRLYGSEGGEAKSLPYPYQTKGSWCLGCFALLAMTESAVENRTSESDSSVSSPHIYRIN